MPGAWRISNVSANRIVGMFIGKNAVENQELLAGIMIVARKRAARRISDYAGRARDLTTNSVEHQPVHARFGRADPVRFLRNNDRLCREICVYAHNLQ